MRQTNKLVTDFRCDYLLLWNFGYCRSRNYQFKHSNLGSWNFITFGRLNFAVWDLSGIQRFALLYFLLQKFLQGQEGHILVFLLITTPCLFIETIKIGLEIITYSLSLESLTMFVVIFMILWAVQYIVYLFWKELRKVRSAQRVLNPGETVVVYSPTTSPTETQVQSSNKQAKSKSTSPKVEKNKKIETKPEVDIGTPV